MDVALTLGGSVLSAFLGVLFHRMAKPEFHNLFRKQKYDDSILEKLKWKLLILRTVLEDAENKQTKNAAVKMWLDQLQELLYQADDLLDLINTEALRIKVESQYTRPVTNQVCASTEPTNFSIEFLKEIMPKLEEIVQKLDESEQKIGILGLVKEVEPKKQQFQRPSTSLVENDECGRDDDIEKIIQYLLSNDGNGEIVNVISIIGLGGIGKTTLAKLVYNDETVNEEFDIKAWVCISEEYDAIRITKSLLNELKISCPDPNETFNSLQLKLKEGLSKKRFLLVLDDIWNRNYNDWLALSAPFSGGKEGSKIILTTRDEKIALTMGKGTQHIHRLNPMLEEDCWSLFKKHALNDRDDIGNLEFELIGKEIVKKCGGLPLAVKAVGGLLRSKETIEEWNEILQSDEWNTSNNQTGILPSLRLSYTHLSAHQKLCFGYCAVFHKDYQFSKDEVILLWMANDLLESPQRTKRLEDVGNEFFRELRLRSLFQQSSEGRFFMHDLVNDLAKFVSGKYFLRLEKNWQQNDSLIVPRHVSYITDEFDVFEKFRPLNQSKILRTFLPIDFNLKGFGVRMLSKKLLLDIFPICKSLRVLSLTCYSITELPNSLSNLKQLRFMDLSYTMIEMLPSWICTFYNLQTLLLTNCWNLKDFPEYMEKLINLRHLDMRGSPLSKKLLEIGRLKDLQFLSSFVVSRDNGSRMEELGKLSNLHGEFTIFGLENIASGKNASMAKMRDKKYVKKLTLEWNGDTEGSQVARDVIENLRPHTNIKHLKIKGFCGTRFPNWLQDSSFCHITDLHISKCENCFCLPAVGQLPSLKHLTMSGLNKVVEMGQEIWGNACLEELCIENCPELIGEIPKQLPLLKKLIISRCPRLLNCNSELTVFNSKAEMAQAIYGIGKPFPCLEELYIKSCPLLTGGIWKQIPSLKKMVICGCPGLVNSKGELTIFDSKADFSSVGELEIRRMPDLKELSSSKLDLNEFLPRLEKLRVADCGNLKLERCGNLTHLCDMAIEELNVKKLSLSLFPILQRLLIFSVRNMVELSIAQGNQNLTSLQSLDIMACDDLVSFPAGGLSVPNLTHIFLWRCPKLKSLPERMHSLLPCLQDLFIRDCPEIECFPEGGLPSSLEVLCISDCERLWSSHGEWNLQTLPSLTSLTLYGVHQQEKWLPEDLLLPSTLKSLSWGENENVKTLHSGVLQHLTCLESLYITRCPKLRSLPEEGLPASLTLLEILYCPLLKHRLEWEKGEDWPKVSHIPRIEIDEELIP